MPPTSSRPRLLVVFYANPDNYPPTFNAVALLSKHFRVHLVCRKSEHESRLWPAGVLIDRVGPSRSTLESMNDSALEKAREFSFFCWAVQRAVKQDQPDLILAYEPHALAAVKLTRTRTAVVYQRHEVEEMGRFDPLSLGGWVTRVAQHASAHVDLLVFPEAGRAQYYQRHVSVPREPLIVPNYPLKESFPRPDFDVALATRKQLKQVFYRGAMGPTNGIRQAVEAMAYVDEDYSLRLCGGVSKEFQAELEERARMAGVSNRVSFAGFVAFFEDLNRYTVQGSVGLMLYQAVGTNWTHSATANNKLYEYAACGVPSVIPDREGFRQFLSGEDWVEWVDETDARSIAAGIGRIVADSGAYEQRSRVARERFERRFNYESVFAPMLDRMVQLADRGRHSRASSRSW